MVSPADIYDSTEYNYRLQNRKVFTHMINILLDNIALQICATMLCEICV